MLWVGLSVGQGGFGSIAWRIATSSARECRSGAVEIASSIISPGAGHRGEGAAAAIAASAVTNTPTTRLSGTTPATHARAAFQRLMRHPTIEHATEFPPPHRARIFMMERPAPQAACSWVVHDVVNGAPYGGEPAVSSVSERGF